MTQTSYHQTYRAACALAAAATLLLTSHARAQMLGQNIFGGTNTSGTSLSTNGATLALSTIPVNGVVGPGFTSTVALSAAARDTLTETINAGNNGTLTAEETGPGPLGFGLGAGGTFTAAKTIGATFQPGQSYSFTLTASNAAAVSLLSGASVTLASQDTGGAPLTVYSTPGGSGLLGLANVVNLFGTSDTTTFSFVAPANVSPTANIMVTISGGLTASALGSTFTFTDAMLTANAGAVPEPGTVGAMGVGVAALATLRFRRRLARG